MAISAVQVVFFLTQERDPAAFPIQIRMVYFALTLFGLWPEVRWYLYLVLLVGTMMVTFFGRCDRARAEADAVEPGSGGSAQLVASVRYAVRYASRTTQPHPPNPTPP